MFGVVMTLLTMIGILGAGVIYWCRQHISEYLHAKRNSAWTTYYFKSKVCTHIHLVPLDGRDHYTAEDGDCQCHTSKENYDEETFVYRHQRLGV